MFGEREMSTPQKKLRHWAAFLPEELTTLLHPHLLSFVRTKSSWKENANRPQRTSRFWFLLATLIIWQRQNNFRSQSENFRIFPAFPPNWYSLNLQSRIKSISESRWISFGSWRILHQPMPKSGFSFSNRLTTKWHQIAPQFSVYHTQ